MCSELICKYICYKLIVFILFDIAAADQDTAKLILVQMENIVQHLELLDPAGQQSLINRGLNNISGIQTRCDSTVADEPETAGQQQWSPSTAEADDESDGKMMNVSSSNRVVTTDVSPSPSISNTQNTSQADENHNMKHSAEVSSLKAKVETLQTRTDTLHADLRRSDNTVSQLKRHIELNTSSDGSQLPVFNAEVIVTLVNEVERLHAELDRRQPVSVSASDGEPSINAGLHQPGTLGVDRSTSPLSIQSLDSTLTDGDVGVINCGMKQRSASFDGILQLSAEPQDKLPVKDEMQDSDKTDVEDRTTSTVHPLPTAVLNIAEGQQSFLGSPAARNMLRQSIMSCLSPFESTSDVNQRTFAELQAEVLRLRRQLQLAQLENSRLLECSARESVDSVGRPSVNPQAEMSLFLDGSLVKYSASGDITVAAGFLKKLVNVSVKGFLS